MSLDIQKEVSKIAGLIGPEDYELASETIPIAVETVTGIEQRYGPDSASRKLYHNAPHSLAVPRRAVSLTNLLWRFIPEEYRTDIYDLDIHCGTGHDEEQDRTLPGENERVSAERMIERVRRADGRLNYEEYMRRLFRGHMATVVQLEDGKLVQPNLAQGEPDTIEFIMGFADRNGIAMEGPLTMLKDGTNLYCERLEETGGELTIDGLVDFLGSGEMDFLKYGLNDWYMKPLIKYYFGDNGDDVYKVMRTAYHPNIDAAHRMAEKIAHGTELTPLIGLAAKGLEVMDSSRLGRNLGKTLIRKLAS